MIRYKFLARDAVTLIVYVVYKILLDVIYAGSIAVSFAYQRMTFSMPRWYETVLFWAIYLLFAMWCSCISRENRLSSVTLVFIFLINFAPSMTLFTFKRSEHWPLYVLFWICLAAAYALIKPGRRRIVITGGKQWIRVAAYICLALSAFVWAYYGHFHVQISLLDVYDQRLIAREYNMPTVVSYIYGSINVMIPTFIVLAIYERKWLEAGLFFAAEILVFFVTGSKLTLFLAGASIGLYFFVIRDSKRTMYLPHILTGILIVGLISDKLLKIGVINDALIRRLMFVPANLNYDYYDFFSTHGFDYFRSSLLSHFGISSPYPMPIPRMIGETYYNTGMNANNGWFSDAYANLGVAGMAIMPTAIVILLRLADRFSCGLHIALLMPAMVSMFVLVGSAFFTNLLTHGLLALLLILFLIPRSPAAIGGRLVSGNWFKAGP